MARRGKKLSIDGTVPGIEYNRYYAGYNRGALDGYPQIDRPHGQQVYDPDPGRMDVFDPAYDGYHWQARQLETPELRFEPMEQPREPHLSLYERGAQLFAIQDELALEMYERSFQRLQSDFDVDSQAGISDEPAGLRTHDDPIDRIAIQMLINRASMGHLEADQEPHATELDPLEQIINAQCQPDPFAEMASALEQQVQEQEMEARFAEPQSEPVPQQSYEDEWQKWMYPFGMPGMGPGPMM